MRAIYNTLPFQKTPAQLVIEMAKTAVFWLNVFPAVGGVSQDLSPRTILTGQQSDTAIINLENTHKPTKNTTIP